MRLVILAALLFGLGVLVLIGFLRLARDLLLKEFFPPPSMPVEAARTRQREAPTAKPKPWMLR
jgi:hypothetical protein